MNEAMIQAAIKAMREEEGENWKLKLGDYDDVYDLATLTLSAAEPLIRAQVIQEIREAAGREDVVDAGLLEYEGHYALDNKVLRDGMQHSMEAMLDQIERTQKP